MADGHCVLVVMRGMRDSLTWRAGGTPVVALSALCALQDSAQSRGDVGAQVCHQSAISAPTQTRLALNTYNVVF